MINAPGQQLENSIRSDLPPHVELDPREEALLGQPRPRPTTLRRLRQILRPGGVCLRAVLVNPAVREVRQARLALARLLSGD
jgi:uncharacterized protein YjiS (DUF1127 family)